MTETGECQLEIKNDQLQVTCIYFLSRLNESSSAVDSKLCTFISQPPEKVLEFVSK